MTSNSVAAAKESILKTSIPSVHASSTTLNDDNDNKPFPTDTSGLSARAKSADPRHLAIALHHARQIQARKETELLIVSHIEALIEFPTSTQSLDSSDNDITLLSPEDVAAFKSYLLPFQPSDYDNLILERNIYGRCGYVLCPNPHRKEDSKAKFRIVWGPKGSGPGGRGKEMKVVPKEKLEMWCSDECAERAMYIRVQLSETPAWERTGKGNNADIKLLEEVRQSRGEKSRNGGRNVDEEERLETVNPEGLPARMVELKIREEGSGTTDSYPEQLALERGEAAAKPSGVGVRILEKEPTKSVVPSAPIPDEHTSSGGSIEGFYPKRKLK